MSLIECIKEYWDSRSSGFSDAILDDIDTSGAMIIDRISKYFESMDVHDVLDLGCGPGFYALMFGSRGLNVVGVDYSDKMIEQARQNAKDRGVEATFIKSDAQNLDLPDSSFDLVVSRDMFWCLENPEKAYSEILRVLRSGGMAIVSDGNYYLHLYDNRYAEMRKRMTSMKGPSTNDKHSRFNKDRVDFKIIEDVAKDLPLSRVQRPTWDIDVLGQLGCTDIEVHLRSRSLDAEAPHLVFSFDIVFTKGCDDDN